MSIVSKIRKFLDMKHIYNSGNQKISAILIVLIVILVLQYPNMFSSTINTVIGKAIILILIVYLTSYNIIAGLFATFVILGLYTYLINFGYEGLENMVIPTTASTADALLSVKPDKVEPYLKTVQSGGPSTFVKPVTPIVTPTVASNSVTSNMLQTEQQIRPKDSGTIPIMPVKNASVAPSSKESFISYPAASK